VRVKVTYTQLDKETRWHGKPSVEVLRGCDLILGDGGRPLTLLDAAQQTQLLFFILLLVAARREGGDLTISVRVVITLRLKVWEIFQG